MAVAVAADKYAYQTAYLLSLLLYSYIILATGIKCQLEWFLNVMKTFLTQVEGILSKECTKYMYNN